VAELSAFPAGDSADPSGSASRDFTSPEGLRVLLVRLHDAGPIAWVHDGEAAELFAFTASKYRPLARKYGLDPWEVVSFAFDAMLAESTVGARDPWAVVTKAVQLTCGAEARGRALLISTGQARHPERLVGFHDAIRFADRENLPDYHPAFAVFTDDDTHTTDSTARVTAALSDTVLLFVSHAWPPVATRDAVQYVSYRRADFATRAAAVDALRRDHDLPALLGLPPRSWTALLRIALGHPDPRHAGTPTGQGVLARLLSGEPLSALRDDAEVTRAIRSATPKGPAS
jgi:hypothetical protein